MRTDKDEYEVLPEEEEDLSPARPHRHGFFRLFKIFAILAILYFAGLCLYIDLYGRWDQAQHAQAIIVLGSQVDPGGVPGDSLRERTLHAVALYKRGLAHKIICTGGLGDDDAITEAKAAADLAEQEGVAGGDLLLETTSRNTWENAVNAAKICRTQQWTHVVVVSDPYHLWRARNNFTAQGLTVYTSPARSCERNRELLLRMQWTVREGLAVTRDIVVGLARRLGK